MKHLAVSLCTAFFIFSITNILAQEKSPVKFGSIKPEDFDLSAYKFDTSVSAVVISDVGSSKFEGNNKGWFSLVFKRQKRIKILNRNGFEAANIEIPLYSNGNSEERLINLKAYTYNLENGNVVTTELPSNAIFKDKLSKNFVNKKFTFPAVKEGSIIELSYTINSDFLFNLQPWTFQSGLPRLWSEYNVSIPSFFEYVTLTQGYQPYDIKEDKYTTEGFNVLIPGGASSDGHVSLTASVGNFRWVMKNVPPLKEEGFTSTLENHLSRIEFQLSTIRLPDTPPENVIGDWYSVTDKLLKREDFGADLEKNNGWLDGEMKAITGGTTDLLQKARNIYKFVRDNFTCTDHSDVYLNNNLKTIFKNRNGSVSDINLLLVAMLRHENIKSDPVILSTRAHGFPQVIYPLMSRFNYVIATAVINDITYNLDASEPLLAFGKLPEQCYNGAARMVAQPPILVNLPADSLKESKTTTVFVGPNDKGELEGSFQTTPGYYEALDDREKIKSKGESDFLKKIKSSYGPEMNITNFGIDSLKRTEDPLTIHYDFKLNMDEDVIYLNPMMAEGWKENIFKAAERKYPVEMPYTFNESYVLNLDIPKNYTVDEIPKSAKVSFNGGEGTFEYMIAKTETGIMLNSKIVMTRANFEPDEYQSLRDFFGYIVKKHGEQIVLKKKKANP